MSLNDIYKEFVEHLVGYRHQNNFDWAYKGKII